MQDFIFPGALVTQLAVLGLYLLGPVAATTVHHMEALGLTLGHALQQFHDVRPV